MKIAVIGAGFTGLTAAYRLAQMGHTVTIFEREAFVGGLAAGYRESDWDWHLESAYHHLFANDTAALNLCHELGVKTLIKRPITANYYQGKTYQFDSPIQLLRFHPLSVIARLRTGVLAAFCKLNPFWQPLESLTARGFIQTIAGTESWHVLWQPLLQGKFGGLARTVSAAWFWARIHKRTPQLCYIGGGYHTLGAALVRAVKKLGGVIHLRTSVSSITKSRFMFHITYQGRRLDFDRILLTVPTPVAIKLVPDLATTDYAAIKHLHAQVLIVETDKPILKNIYWLNVLDRHFPFLAVVAHTNFMDAQHYAGHHLTYFGNYLSVAHPYLSMDKQQLLRVFLPFIKKLQPNFSGEASIIRYRLFTGFNAQPVHERHYSRYAPRLHTPITGLYLANLDSIFPWDRGVNYAVELGDRAAGRITQEI